MPVAILVSLLMTAGHTGTPNPQAGNGECRLAEVPNSKLWQRLSEQEQQSFGRTRARLCEVIAAGKTTTAQALSALWDQLVAGAACDGRQYSPAFAQQWADRPESDAVRIALGEFCGRRRHRAGLRWWRIEMFCLTSRYFVDPGGWHQVIVPKTASWQQLRERAADLCASAHAGRISLDDAWYQWRQASLTAVESLKSETVVDSVAVTYRIMKELLKLAGDIVGILK